MTNIIELKNIVKNYNVKKKIKVLNKINFSFKAGKIYSLMGPSGSGKSTLLNLLSLIDTPNSGTLKILNNIEDGSEIITSAVNFPTTLNPILQNNLTPVLVDAEKGTYNINVDLIESQITKKTKAIVYIKSFFIMSQQVLSFLDFLSMILL